MKKQRINIPIMYCFDTNYVIPAAVAFYSLMEHASNDYDYTFYILHSDITEYQQDKLKETVSEFKNCKLEFIDMNHRLDDIWNKIYKGGHFSKEVMYKLLVASIFPDIDKLIVSDVDVVFLNDISESYFDLTDKDDAYIAGVKPIGKIADYLENYAPEWTPEEISKMGNVCGGYLVMNLKKIREDDYEQVFINSMIENGHRLNQMEQDIFNITCYGKIKHLHLKYVACSYMWDYYKTDEDKETDINYSKKEIEEAMDKPVQLHYATSIKPWKNVDCTLSVEWFKYIVKTPFAEEYFKNLPNKIVLPKDRVVTKVVNEKGSFFEKIRSNKFWRVIEKIVKSPDMFFTKEFYKKVGRKLFKKNYSYIIFDDVFPSKLSPFRFEEFTNYALDNNNTFFATTGSSLIALKEYRPLEKVIEEFQVQNPYYYNRIFDVSEENREESLEKIKNIKNPLAIVVFEQNLINDIYDNLDFFEKNDIPFVITLYPGGGLMINDKKSDDKLKRMFKSNCFKKVIVTQENVKKYLLDKKLCNEEDIEFIFGIVTPKEVLNTKVNNKKYYPNKENLNICFVAHKYAKDGVDKGFDLFIETAKSLLKKNKNIKFYVVGDFNEEDIDIKNIKNNIVFKGILSTENLIKFYKDMDIIISPTRPFVLSKGSFDGFPTGSTTEAMLNGVLAITTDELELNSVFSNDEIIIVKPDVKDIVNKINYLIDNSEEIERIAKNGRKKCKSVYSYKNQVSKRIKLVNNVAKKHYKNK